MSSTTRAILAAILIGVITISTILIVQKLVGGIYTLSEGTRNILSSLGQTIRLKLFYSRVAAMKGPEEIRFYNNYYQYVRSLLEEYIGLADGRLKLEVFDPRPFSDEEDEALRYGIRRFQITENEGFFFGLVAESELGKDKVIEFFEPERQEFIEYDISKLISGVIQRDKKKIGIISSLPVMGSDMSPYMMQMLQMQGRQPEQPWTIVTHLREEYEVVSIPGDTDSIADDVDYLMLVHPKDLETKTLFAIDQYVMRGGKLIVFIDPYSISDRPPRDPQNPYGNMNYDSSSDLNVLLEKWGVKMEPGIFAADRDLAIKAALYRGQPPVPIVTYLGLNDDCVNSKEVITAKLHNIQLLYAGVLKPTESAESDNIEVTPLLTTTANGGTWKPSGSFELRMPNPEEMMKSIVPSDKPEMLACRISGTLESNYPNGLSAEGAGDDDSEEINDVNGEEEAKAEKPETLKKSSPEAEVVVVADVDVISDTLAYQQTFFGAAQTGDNASLLLNTLDFLGGSSDLIAIRSRGRFQRPFTVVDKIEEEAEKATADKVAAVNARIADYEKKLKELSNQAESSEDTRLLETRAVAERKQIEEEIRKARKELRRLNAGKRESIEALGATLLTINMVLAPAVVLLIAVFIATLRYLKAKRYAARRYD